jgi:hypothetical protein
VMTTNGTGNPCARGAVWQVSDHGSLGCVVTVHFRGPGGASSDTKKQWGAATNQPETIEKALQGSDTRE